MLDPAFLAEVTRAVAVRHVRRRQVQSRENRRHHAIAPAQMESEDLRARQSRPLEELRPQQGACPVKSRLDDVLAHSQAFRRLGGIETLDLSEDEACDTQIGKTPPLLMTGRLPSEPLYEFGRREYRVLTPESQQIGVTRDQTVGFRRRQSGQYRRVRSVPQ